MMDLKKIYTDAGAFLKGHFLLSSGKHSKFYLQSAKVLEDPKVAELLAKDLAEMIKKSGIEVDTVCAPALGGILAGYELARALGARFIFAERVEKVMTIRRGFEVKKDEKILMCEDIITTGGSVLEAASQVEKQGGKVVAFAALANRGFCKREGSNNAATPTCKLQSSIPFFALGDFEFDIYDEADCPLCKDGSKAFKPGSRGN